VISNDVQRTTKSNDSDDDFLLPILRAPSLAVCFQRITPGPIRSILAKFGAWKPVREPLCRKFFAQVAWYA
jgi:hypothetical protein